MEAIKEALTFDDVLLLPRFSKILPSETDISLNLTDNINLTDTIFSVNNLLNKLTSDIDNFKDKDI